MKLFLRLVFVCVVLLSCSQAGDREASSVRYEPTRMAGSLPVFPGAEGFGSRTLAGCGGRIIKVTNLNDSGNGSFRAAATASGPRIVVFEVGGSIDLKKVVVIRNPYLTIAGQTAPEPGVQLRNYGIEIDTHDVLVRHLRVRVAGGEKDGVRIHGFHNQTYNVVIDHVTANWATDENISIWAARSGSGVHDVTISNCLIAEGIVYGLLLGTDGHQPRHVDRVSIYKNLFAHNRERNPRITNNSRVFVANNLAYNCGTHGFTVVGGPIGASEASFIGNHYIGGFNSRGPAIGLKMALLSGQYYIKDCMFAGKYAGPLLNQRIRSLLVKSPPIYDSSLSILPVSKIRTEILKYAGARPARRDSVEKRIFHEVETESGVLKNSISAAGGWPKDYDRPSYRPFETGADPHGDDDGDGYSNIEEILAKMAARVEGRNP